MNGIATPMACFQDGTIMLILYGWASDSDLGNEKPQSDPEACNQTRGSESPTLIVLSNTRVRVFQ